jgi:hypothetical protein
VYESERSLRISGHAASRAPKTSSSRSSIASSVATTPPSDLRARSYQGGCTRTALKSSLYSDDHGSRKSANNVSPPSTKIVCPVT